MTDLPAKRAKNRQDWILGGLSCAAILLVSFGSPGFRQNETDFLSFYAGARLAGTPNLYVPEAARAIQQQVSHPRSIVGYLRPPFYAAFLWPLGRLPYPIALTLWIAVNLGALGLFIALWSPTPVAVILCAWFLPAWFNMASGQDDTLMLACVAVGAFLLKRERPLSAGLVLSLCAAKFQLFFLLPLFILANRLWRTALGFSLGALILVVISFATAGWSWPRQYLAILRLADHIDPIGKMPNLYGLFHGSPLAGIWISILSAAIAAAVWRCVRRTSLYYGLAVTVLGSLLVSFHAYLYDCILLLPILLVLAEETGLGTLMPIYIGLTVGMITLPLPALHAIGQILLLGFFSWLVIRGRRREGHFRSLLIKSGVGAINCGA